MGSESDQLAGCVLTAIRRLNIISWVFIGACVAYGLYLWLPSYLGL